MSEGTNIASERACDSARTHKNWHQMHDLKSSNNDLKNTFCAFFKLYYAKDYLYHDFWCRLKQYLLLFLIKKNTKGPQLEPIAPTLVLTPLYFLLFSTCSICYAWKLSRKATSNVLQDMNTSNVQTQGNNNSQKSACARNKWTNNHEHPLYDTPMIYSVSKQLYDFMTLLVDFTWAVYMLYLFFSLVSAENFIGKIIIAAHFQTVLLRELNVTNIYKCGDDSYVRKFIV